MFWQELILVCASFCDTLPHVKYHKPLQNQKNLTRNISYKSINYSKNKANLTNKDNSYYKNPNIIPNTNSTINPSINPKINSKIKTNKISSKNIKSYLIFINSKIYNIFSINFSDKILNSKANNLFNYNLKNNFYGADPPYNKYFHEHLHSIFNIKMYNLNIFNFDSYNTIISFISYKLFLNNLTFYNISFNKSFYVIFIIFVLIIMLQYSKSKIKHIFAFNVIYKSALPVRAFISIFSFMNYMNYIKNKFIKSIYIKTKIKAHFSLLYNHKNIKFLIYNFNVNVIFIIIKKIISNYVLKANNRVGLGSALLYNKY